MFGIEGSMFMYETGKTIKIFLGDGYQRNKTSVTSDKCYVKEAFPQQLMLRI